MRPRTECDPLNVTIRIRTVMSATWASVSFSESAKSNAYLRDNHSVIAFDTCRRLKNADGFFIQRNLRRYKFDMIGKTNVEADLSRRLKGKSEADATCTIDRREHESTRGTTIFRVATPAAAAIDSRRPAQRSDRIDRRAP